MMISSIQLDKRPLAQIPMANTRPRVQLAPLASLDCSITEPLTDSHTTTTETPTLSGYFDCDQLSDMVDDSLFEITNAGCLSKSVFSGGRLVGVSPIGEEEQASNNGIWMPETAGGGSELENGDQDSGTLTPTNEHPYPVQVPELCVRKMETTMTPVTQENIFKQHQPSQVAMVAEHPAYDYSSTSTIPAQSSRWAQGNGGHRQRSRSARFASSSGSAPPSRAVADNDEDDPASGRAGGVYKNRRKARSNPDVRDQQETVSRLPEAQAQQENEGLCSECRQLAASQHGSHKRGKEKRRFTFSLFNLFSGGGTQSDNHHHLKANDDKKAKDGDMVVCTHKRHHHQHQATSNGGNMAPAIGDHVGTTRASVSASSTMTSNNRRRSSAMRDPSSGAPSKIKSRDSIRIMNQRKRRQELKASQTCTDFQNKNQTNELLLDLSQGPPPANSSHSTRVGGPAFRSSQSSYSVVRNGYSGEKNHHDVGGGGGNDDGTNGSQQQRQTKSVKFTMQDKVMIMPSGPGKRAPGSSNPPPAYLQPSAPIIKRSVPKSTSFSQTDSNRSLEELLAKYEVNNELITELNERLKLTETIASPISALDQVVPAVASYDNNQVKHYANFTITNNNQPIYALDPANDRIRAINIVNTCCDPISLPTSSLSSETENAGFSREWLEKQHRGLM